MCPTNKTQFYSVMPSLIGWTHTQNDPWIRMTIILLLLVSILYAVISNFTSGVATIELLEWISIFNPHFDEHVMWLLILAGNKVKPCFWKSPSWFYQYALGSPLRHWANNMIVLVSTHWRSWGIIETLKQCWKVWLFAMCLWPVKIGLVW